MPTLRAILHLETTRIEGSDAWFDIPASGNRVACQLPVDLGNECLRIVDERVPPTTAPEPKAEGSSKVSAVGACPDHSWAYEDILQFMVVREIPVPAVASGKPSKQRLIAACNERRTQPAAVA